MEEEEACGKQDVLQNYFFWGGGWLCSNTRAAMKYFLSHISTLSLLCWRGVLAAIDCQNMS